MNGMFEQNVLSFTLKNQKRNEQLENKNLAGF